LNLNKNLFYIKSGCVKEGHFDSMTEANRDCRCHFAIKQNTIMWI